jgi:Flp pilus assembly secretin CpaC
MENYFSTLSKWIANLGVVPWLLFLAFLLLPIFTFLASLLFLVTLVLETISQLLCAQMYCWYNYSRFVWHNLKFNNRKKLHTFKFLVKGLLYLSLALNTSHASPSRKAQSFQRLISGEVRSLSLSKGEIVELPLRGIEKYSVTNKEVLTARAENSHSKLLLKAKSLGQTYLYLWEKGGRVRKIEVFVHSKRHNLSLKKLSHQIETLGLETRVLEKKVIVSGTIENEQQYESLLHLRNSAEKKILIDERNLKIEPKIRLKKYQQLVEVLSERNLLDLDCNPQKVFIYCKGSNLIRESLVDLNQRFLLRFPNEKEIGISDQYQVSLTLQQYENAQGEAFEFGLQKIEGKLNHLLLSDPLSLIRENQISLKSTDFKSQTLASPILKGRLNRPMKVRIGQEINFLQSVTNGIATQSWRFAGLGIDITLVPHTDRILLKFKTNLSQPGESGISINTQESELLIDLDKEQVLFDIGFRVNHKRSTKIPFLGDIPLFGSLFKGRGNEKSFKKVLCIVHIKEI